METENPFNQDVPTDSRERARAFARDVAYGVIAGFWKKYVRDYGDDMLGLQSELQYQELYDTHFLNKWNNKWPRSDVLELLGYFDRSNSSLVMTEKALALLETPATPPNVFISYCHDESSVLALLIEARLKLVGNPNPFIDKDLEPGDVWHAMLKERVENCRYFVCLVGKTTLNSKAVLDEIRWAEQSDRTIISVWHNKTTFGNVGFDIPPALSKLQVIIVNVESALEYEIAVNRMLNKMGYSTY